MVQPHVRISKIEFKSSQSFQMEPGEVLVIVGPNNSGKSVLLREIADSVKYNNQNRPGWKVLNACRIDRIGQPEDIQTLVKQIGRIQGNSIEFYGSQTTEVEWKNIWLNDTDGLGALSSYFCTHLGTSNRLTYVDPIRLIDFTSRSISDPRHRIYEDSDVEKKLSQIFQKAFGQELVVGRMSGIDVTLHMGVRPAVGTGELSLKYGQAVRQLPPLHEQGDGIKSFTSIILNAYVDKRDILIIDEPEAFLHPPQARLLGQTLAKSTEGERQLFLATHDGNFLRGVINSGSSHTRVVRLRRSGDQNYIHELPPGDLSRLWSDPLLRHSNALDGIFHERVIVCESDSDCRFYNAIFDAMWNTSDGVPPDVMFTHVGGKDRVPMLVQALRAVDVPTSVVVDFDVLSDEHLMAQLVGALGFSWSNFQHSWKIVYDAIAKKKPELDREEVKKQIEEIIARDSGQQLSKSSAEAIRKCVKQSSPWAIAKAAGRNYLPSGAETRAFKGMSNALAQIGFHIVPDGELESFDRAVDRHGPAWVNQVVLKNLANDPDLETARQFVKQITESALS